MSLESLVGNLFVLAAVIVILVVYRQLDKNNRSLDKIRKFAEGVRDDLNAFVEERTAAVRDLEAVLKAHDKTGAEILKRIQAVESGLLNRVPEIEQLQGRLDRYAGSMTELEAQTQRIDTHLARVKEETVFVDRVSQRIKGAGDQMTALEASFGQIRQEFADINQKDLETVRKNTADVFEQETLAYVKKLAAAQQRVDAFEAFVAELDSKKNAFVREAEAAIDSKARDALAGAEASLLDTARQAEDLSMVVFLKLEEKIENQAQESETRLRAAIDEREAALRSAAADLAARLSAMDESVASRMVTTDQTLTARLSAMDDSLESRLSMTDGELAARLSAIDDSVAARALLLESLGVKAEEAETLLKQNFESEQTQLLSMTAQLKSDLDDTVALVRKSASDESDAVRREFHSALELDRQTSKALVAEVRKDFESERSQMLSMTAQLKNELETTVAEVRQRATVESDAVRREVQSALEHEQQTSQALAVEIRELIEAVRTDTHEDERRAVEGIEARLTEYESGFTYRFTQLEQAEKDLAQLDTNLRQAMEKAAEKIQSDFAAFDTAMAQRRQDEQAQLESKLGTANDSLVKLDKDLEELKSRAYDNISQKFQGVEEEFFADLQRRAASMMQSVEDWQADLNARFETLRASTETEQTETSRQATDGLKSRVQELQTASYQQLEKLDRQIQDAQESAATAVSGYREDVEKTRSRLAEELSEFERGVETRLGSDRTRIELAGTESLTRLERDLDAKVKFLGDELEKVRGDYQSGLDGAQAEFNLWQARFAQKFKELDTEVQEQQGLLRSSIVEKIGVLTADYTAQKEELLDRSTEDRQVLKNDLAQIRVQVDDLDASLRSRSQAAIEAFTREQDELAKELLDRSAEDRQVLKNDLAQIRSQIVELDGSLRARSQAAVEAFTREQDELAKELLERSTEDRQGLKNDLAQIRAQVDELDGSLRSRSQAAIEAFTRGQDEFAKELLDRSVEERQSLKDDLTQIRSQIIELDGSLRSRSQAAIDAFTREHESVARELQERSAEDRQLLKNDLAQIRGLIDELDGSLRTRSQAAIEGFTREYEDLSQEFQKKNRELANDIDNRLRDYRDAVADTRDKADIQQKKAFAKIEDQTALFNVTIDEIEKRQKNFVAQTKIFERADTLREELQQAVEDLKSDITRVEVQRKDLFEIEAAVARIKKIGDETSDKAAKFTAEKKRIDLMDADFQRIVSLSQSMELRLEQVTSSHDLLQEMQLRIRKLEDYSKDVETRYDRLEKRREVLDTTTDGVDRNFALLEKIESSVRGLDSELKTMPAEVEDLRKRLKVLAQGKEDADHAVERLATLDQTLKEVEGRIGRMEQAREWIAGVETRLTETKAAAEEQVQTLATIHKAAGTPVKGKSADSDMRQTVLKLARQGWGKDEISRATKLSLGEVELILELGTR